MQSKSKSMAEYKNSKHKDNYLIMTPLSMWRGVGGEV